MKSIKTRQKKINLTSAFLLIYLCLLLIFPEASSEGVKEGLRLCSSVLIPSLYPFLVCSSLFAKSGVLTGVSHKGLSLFILSFTGGYPVGAGLISELYERGETDKNEAVRLLSYCINPSVSFAFSTVGITLLKSRKAGLLILSALVLSSLTTALLSGLLRGKAKGGSVHIDTVNTESFSSLLVSSIKEGLFSMITICGFVVLFSSLSFIAEAIPTDKNISLILRCVLEVTGGVVLTAESFSLPWVTALISFGGFSTLFQLKSILRSTDIAFLTLFAQRAASALFSGLYTFLLLKLFPLPAETFGAESFTVTSSPSYSVSVSLCLVLMSVLFIMGDSVIGKKSLTDKNTIK